MNFDSIIIGAGISGLSIAYYLKKAGQNILLLEASERVGGVIQSLDADGFLLERGPNSLRGTHELLDLVDDLQLQDELVAAYPKAPAFVYFQKSLHPVPMSPPALIKTKLLSTKAKFRLLREPFIAARKGTSEESLDSFVRRRLGDEILERFVAPFVSGVYAGDPKQLSIQASFARLAEFEMQAGSILKGAIKAARAAKSKHEPPKRSLRPYRLCSFQKGLETLPQAMAKSLGESLVTGACNIELSRISDFQFQVNYEHQNQRETVTTRTLIVATPASAASQMLDRFAPEITKHLAEIHSTKLCAVPLAYRIDQLPHPLDGFGFLAPRDQGLRTLGSIWNSSLFPHRAPEGWVVMNNFIGGETDREAINLSDDELITIVHRDLQTVLGIKGEPKRLPITRWQRAIPQYNLGHAARIAAIEKELSQHEGLWLTGNYLHGVAIGDCLKRGKDLTEEIVEWMSKH
ncbi:MAG: protoporphyrinogen oxidase [Acidobacteria bacterium]|nr:protoporphyrinogen oxidase [Acidobacteriota bacterium]